MESTGKSRYLNPAELAMLGRLSPTTRRPVVGRFAGRHASQHHGRGVEFADYRAYQPGDPPDDVDWKTYARTDRLFLKLFEQQTDLSLAMLVDASASMGYSGYPPREGNSKYDFSARCAAAMAFLATRQGDRVLVSLAQDGLRGNAGFGATPQHLHAVLNTLESTTPAGTADLTAAIRSLIPRLPRRALLVVLSDLLDATEQLFPQLARYQQGGGRVAVFHLLHPDEWNLPSIEDAVFVDSESAERLTVNPAQVRARYAERFRAFLDYWATGCARRGIDYFLASTADPYPELLRRFLHGALPGHAR